MNLEFGIPAENIRRRSKFRNGDLKPEELKFATPPELKKQKKERSKREALFYSRHIIEDPEKNENNPVCSFDSVITLRKSSYVYGAGANVSSIEPSQQVKFLTKPSLNNDVWAWHVQNLVTGETGYIWTINVKRGTVLTRRRGQNRKPTVIGKPAYLKYKRLQDIAFIKEDVI